MRRMLATLLLVALVCSITSVSLASSVDSKFDKNVFTDSPYYKYDKFKKTWSLEGEYTKEYRNAKISISIGITDGYVDSEFGPVMVFSYFDKENSNYDSVTAFRAIIGEKTFVFENVSGDEGLNFIIACNTFEQFCNTLNTSKEIAFQFDHTDKFGRSYTSTIDPVDTDALIELKVIAKLLKNSNAWSTCPNKEKYDTIFEASIE